MKYYIIKKLYLYNYIILNIYNNFKQIFIIITIDMTQDNRYKVVVVAAAQRRGFGFCGEATSLEWRTKTTQKQDKPNPSGSLINNPVFLDGWMKEAGSYLSMDHYCYCSASDLFRPYIFFHMLIFLFLFLFFMI